MVGHHAYTNLACDPDIRVSEHDVRRVAPHHPKQPYHVRRSSPTHDCCLSLLFGLWDPCRKVADMCTPSSHICGQTHSWAECPPPSRAAQNDGLAVYSSLLSLDATRIGFHCAWLDVWSALVVASAILLRT